MHTLRSLFLLVFSLGLLSLATPALAAPSPSSLDLAVTPTSAKVGDTITAHITLTTSDAVSAAKVHLSYASGLHYVSTSFTDSAFSTVVSPATDDGSSVSFALTRTDTGYSGTNGLVAIVTFKVTATGSQSLSIDQAQSQLIAYSDSSNTLADVATTAIPVQTDGGTLTQTGSNSLWIIGAAVTLTAAAFFLGRRPKKQE